jgi:hypothetical protein
VEEVRDMESADKSQIETELDWATPTRGVRVGSTNRGSTGWREHSCESTADSNCGDRVKGLDGTTAVGLWCSVRCNEKG